MVFNAGREFPLGRLELGLNGTEPSPSTSFILQEGERVLRAGAAKAEEKLTPVLETRANNLLRAVTGDHGLTTKLAVGEGGKVVGATIVLNKEPGLPPEALARLAGEIFGISPETVEVEKVFVGKGEGKED